MIRPSFASRIHMAELVSSPTGWPKHSTRCCRTGSVADHASTASAGSLWHEWRTDAREAGLAYDARAARLLPVMRTVVR